MRISDWSSDVCSSDLRHIGRDDPVGVQQMPIKRIAFLVGAQRKAAHAAAPTAMGDQHDRRSAAIGLPDGIVGRQEIGMAAGRESVCQYVYISVATVSLKKICPSSQKYTTHNNH